MPWPGRQGLARGVEERWEERLAHRRREDEEDEQIPRLCLFGDDLERVPTEN